MTNRQSQSDQHLDAYPQILSLIFVGWPEVTFGQSLCDQRLALPLGHIYNKEERKGTSYQFPVSGFLNPPFHVVHHIKWARMRMADIIQKLIGTDLFFISYL